MRACIAWLLAACAADETGPSLASIGPVPAGLFTIDDSVAWFSPGDGTIQRLDLATRTLEQFGAIDPTAIDPAAIGNRVYWSQSDHLERCGTLYVTTAERVERAVPEDDLCWSVIGSFERRLIVSQRDSPSSIGETTIGSLDVDTLELAVIDRFFSGARIRLVEHRLAIIESGVARIFDLRTDRTVEIPIAREAPFWFVPTDDSLAWLENDRLMEQRALGGPFEIATVSVFGKELGRVGSVWTFLDERSSNTGMLRVDGAGRAHEWPVGGMAETSLGYAGAYWFTTIDEELGGTLWRFGP